MKTHVKEIISPLQVERMFTLDFNDKGTEEKSLSFEDRRFLKTAKEGIHQREDGHYEMPLPLRNENVELPNNKDLALSRLMKLKQKLQSDTIPRGLRWLYARDHRERLRRESSQHRGIKKR